MPSSRLCSGAEISLFPEYYRQLHEQEIWVEKSWQIYSCPRVVWLLACFLSVRMGRCCFVVDFTGATVLFDQQGGVCVCDPLEIRSQRGPVTFGYLASTEGQHRQIVRATNGSEVKAAKFHGLRWSSPHIYNMYRNDVEKRWRSFYPIAKNARRSKSCPENGALTTWELLLSQTRWGVLQPAQITPLLFPLGVLFNAHFSQSGCNFYWPFQRPEHFPYRWRIWFICCTCTSQFRWKKEKLLTSEWRALRRLWQTRCRQFCEERVKTSCKSSNHIKWIPFTKWTSHRNFRIYFFGSEMWRSVYFRHRDLVSHCQNAADVFLNPFIPGRMTVSRAEVIHPPFLCKTLALWFWERFHFSRFFRPIPDSFSGEFWGVLTVAPETGKSCLPFIPTLTRTAKHPDRKRSYLSLMVVVEQGKRSEFFSNQFTSAILVDIFRVEFVAQDTLDFNQRLCCASQDRIHSFASIIRDFL